MFATIDGPPYRQQLIDSVRDYAARSARTSSIRDDISSSAGFSQIRWKEMADLGWTSLLIPESLGGLGLLYADLVALHSEVGRAVLPEPLAIVPILAGFCLVEGENQELAEALLPDLLAGDLITSLAWQGEAGALGEDGVGPHAVKQADKWHLYGTAQFVPCASSAAGLIVAANTDNGTALFWLDHMPPLTDHARQVGGLPQSSVDLKGISLGEQTLLAGPGKGGEILEKALDTARLAACAELIGIMEKALEMTLDHLRQREQFAKPIGSNQALQHRAVDLFIQIELSRSAVDRAATVMDTGGDATEISKQVSAAKSRCADAARQVLRECIQMHGAIGYTAEYDLSLYLNRALHLSSWLGNSTRHRERWARLNIKGSQSG